MAKDFLNILQLFKEIFGSKKQEALDLQSVFINLRFQYFIFWIFFPLFLFFQVINMAIPHYIL